MMTTKKALENSIYFQNLVLTQSTDLKQKERASKAIGRLQAELDKLLGRASNPAKKNTAEKINQFTRATGTARNERMARAYLKSEEGLVSDAVTSYRADQRGAKQKFSPAQLAAQKLFAERSRSGALKKAKPGVKVAKSNPIQDAGEFVMTVNGKSKTRFFVFGDDQWARSYGFEYRLLSDVTQHGSPVKFTKTRAIVATDKDANGKPITDTWSIRGLKFYKNNPDKTKPQAYVRRVSQVTGEAPNKRLIARRKANLTSPAGYFPNPKSSLISAYQVICMRPKKHAVIGVFKTTEQAKQIGVAMANLNNVPYAVKAVKVHKTHFAL